MATNPNLYGDGTTSDDAQRNQGQTAKIDRKKMGERDAPNDPLLSRYWREIERYEKSAKDWHDQGDAILSVYMEEAADKDSGSSRKFPLLWANTDVLKPAVYAKMPTLQCSRRHKDKDPIAKVCSEIMERATNTTFDLYNTNETFEMVRDDRLLPGRGQVWVRYEASIDRYEDPEGATDDQGEPVYREKLKNERVCVDYVGHKDFGHNVARTWHQDVWLVWRKVYQCYEEVEERFGTKIAAALNYSTKPPGSSNYAKPDNNEDQKEDCACIYEVWDKKNRRTSWICKGFNGWLETGKPPIDFREFFPTPQPCYATKTSKQLIPRPDYLYYRNQAREINDLTEKISRMSEWLIVKGFVPGGPSTVADPIEEAIRDKSNSELFVQVDSWKDFTERGGAAKLIDWLPLDMVMKALAAAIQTRNQLIQDVFQIMGISDILRGQTDPDETLGAQELKAQTGTRRLRNIKDDLARFCRDTGRLVAEVIAEKFEPSSLAAISGYKYVPQQAPALPGLPPQAPPLAAPASPMMMGHNGGPGMDEEESADSDMVFDERHMELLRNDKMRNFRIDVETDSTIQADENAEKAQRIEFVEGVGKYLGEAAQLLQAPAAAPLAPALCEIILFLVRGFRAGRSMEEALESGFKKVRMALETQAQQAANAPPPQMVEAQTELAKIKMQLAGDAAASQQDAAIRAKEAESNAAIKAQALIADTQLKSQAQAADLHLETMKAKNDMAIAQNKGAMEVQRQNQDAALEQRRQNIDSQIKSRQLTDNASAKAQDRIARAMQSQRQARDSVH